MTTPQDPTAQDPAPQNPARWAPDPLGRHQYRYWDGAQWTEHVSDDGVVRTDPPVVDPAPSPSPSPAPSPWAAPASGAGDRAQDRVEDRVVEGADDVVDRGPADAGYAAPTPGSGAGAVGAGSFGATHLGAPLPGSGATAAAAAWQQPAWQQPGLQPGYGSGYGHDATSVLGRRYGAFLIDAAISLIVFGILFFATASTHTRAEMLQKPGCHLSANDSSQVECDNRAVITVNDTVYETSFGLWALLCVAFTFLYFAVMEGTTGGSPGKHMTGLTVVTPTGQRIGFGRALGRWAVFAVDGPLSFFLCGIITSSVSSGHRRLGDMAAGSYVIGKADAGHPVSVRPR